MKIKRLLPIALMATSLLIGCGGGNKGPVIPDENEDGVHAITIANEAELTPWYVGMSKTLEVKLIADGEEYGVATETRAKNFSLVSSNSKILALNGLVATAGNIEGTVTLSFKWYDTVKNLEIAVSSKPTNKDLYGTEHEGTEEDPFTNEDALLACAYYREQGYEQQTVELFIEGEVESFYHAPGSGNKGDLKACSWYFKPAQKNGAKFEVYIAHIQDESGADRDWTVDDIWVGATVKVAVSKFNNYNDQLETGTNCTRIISISGEKPEIHTYEATVAEAITEGRKLDHQGSTTDKYAVTGYVVKKSGNNYWMNDTATVAGNDYEMFELYGVTNNTFSAKLLKNAKVTVTATLKRYGQDGATSQIETAVIDSVEVIAEGGTWEVIPEPAVEVKTLAEFIALENSKAKAYKVTANIKAFKSGATKDKYGNMTLTDGTNDLVVYGSTATATALAWNNADAYTFTNPQDFITNAKTNALSVGDEITVKMIRSDYTKDGVTTIQGNAVILFDEGGGGGGVPETEKTVAEALTIGAALANKASTPEEYDVVGYVVKTDGSNYFMADTKTVAENDTDMFELYKPSADHTGKLLKNAKVKVTCKIKKYNSQIEDGGITAVTVLEAGESWGGNPEPAVTTRTVTEFVAGENTKAVAYQVTAQIKSFADNKGNAAASASKYGNMIVTDGTTDLFIYGITATASALVWSEAASTYSFTNAQDFTTNSTTKDLKAGDTITMKLIRADYNSTIEGTGIILSVGA